MYQRTRSLQKRNRLIKAESTALKEKQKRRTDRSPRKKPEVMKARYPGQLPMSRKTQKRIKKQETDNWKRNSRNQERRKPKLLWPTVFHRKKQSIRSWMRCRSIPAAMRP